MKKKNYLFAAVCSMCLFTACEDNDDVKIPSTQTTFTTEEGLILAVNGEPMVGKVATFTPATESSKATISLSGEALDLSAFIGGSKANVQPVASVPTCGVIPGSPEVTIPVDILDGEFSGSYETDYCTFNYAGGFSKNSLEIILSDVELKNKKLSNTTWTLSEIERDMWGDTISGVADPVRLVWESSKDFDIELYPGLAIQMPLANIIGIMTQMPLVPIEAADTVLGLQEALPQLLHQVTFEADGNIRARYVDAVNGGITPVESPANLAQYVVKDDNTILVFLNIQNVIYNASQKSKAAGDGELDLAPVMQVLNTYLPYVKNGVPLEYTVVGDNMSVFLNTQFLMPIVTAGASLMEQPTIQQLILNMVENSDDEMLKSFAETLKSILPQVPDVLKGTTRIEIGLNLEKAN
ncbi:MAG: DUF4925 domain-containing protein [Bacteroides sp.]|nr:DUF4925 domain-containing protein [Bacteroides sp.]MCM1389519.1 DUF4925 domain-containing protein [Bacteroides sp.]